MAEVTRTKAYLMHFEEWLEHPMTRAFLHSISEIQRVDSIDFPNTIPVTEDLNRIALAYAKFQGIQGVYRTLLDRELLKSEILDECIDWYEDLNKRENEKNAINHTEEIMV